ncbi:MAG: hypothetical protein AAGC74_02285 [Verrucomicrobiota bacterium]
MDLVLMDAVEAFLRRGEGLVSGLLIGGASYDWVANSQGEQFLLGYGMTGGTKPKLGVDDFGESRLLGQSGRSKPRGEGWEVVRLPGDSLKRACETDLVQGYFRFSEDAARVGQARRELALVAKKGSRWAEGAFFERLVKGAIAAGGNLADPWSRFAEWDCCGSLEGLFVPGRRWESWVEAKTVGRSPAGSGEFLLEVERPRGAVAQISAKGEVVPEYLA